VSDAEGAVAVKNSFGLTHAERVGSLSVESANGTVRGSSVRGAVDVRTSFAPVVLSQVDGGVDVRNQNGSIEVSGVTPKGPAGCHRLSLTTSFAPITLTLPSGAGFNVSARTSFGKIQSALPLTTTGALGGDSLAGTIGGGGCELTLVNSSGNITLGAAAAPAAR
jgi:DUF4097 and DUF4098 domain-containing protein YvlB